MEKEKTKIAKIWQVTMATHERKRINYQYLQMIKVDKWDLKRKG